MPIKKWNVYTLKVKKKRLLNYSSWSYIRTVFNVYFCYMYALIFFMSQYLSWLASRCKGSEGLGNATKVSILQVSQGFEHSASEDISAKAMFWPKSNSARCGIGKLNLQCLNSW